MEVRTVKFYMFKDQFSMIHHRAATAPQRNDEQLVIRLLYSLKCLRSPQKRWQHTSLPLIKFKWEEACLNCFKYPDILTIHFQDRNRICPTPVSIFLCFCSCCFHMRSVWPSECLRRIIYTLTRVCVSVVVSLESVLVFKWQLRQTDLRIHHELQFLLLFSTQSL